MSEVSTKSNNPKDRRFDPSLQPRDTQLVALVARAVDRALMAEVRARRRRPADQRTFEAAVSCIVLNLLYGELEGLGRRTAVGMTKADYGTAVRPASFMTQHFPETVKLLHHAEILDLELGERTAFAGRRSTIGPGAWLLQQLETIDLGYECFRRDPALLGPPVILRSPKVKGVRKVIPLPATDEAQQLVRQMESINDWLASADLDWTGEPVDLSRRRLVRIFCDGSFQRGGRLWQGFWIQQSRAARAEHLRIGGEPTVSLDFAHMGVTLAYSEIRANPPRGDLYDIPQLWGRREGVKKVLNALLCSSEVPTRFPAGTRAYFPKSWTFESVFEAICRHHAPLVPLFGTAQALRFQYLESQVMVSALLSLRDKGVVGLPVHDALLVRRSDAPTAKEILERAFKDVTGIEGRVEGPSTYPL